MRGNLPRFHLHRHADRLRADAGHGYDSRSKGQGAGKIEVQIDGQTCATTDLSISGPRLAQQSVCEVTSLISGKHIIDIVNRGPGPVAVDALFVR